MDSLMNLQIKETPNTLIKSALPTLYDEGGNYWYPAREVCTILGFKNYRDAVRNHLTSAQTAYTLRGKPGKGKKSRVLMINQAGVYHLLFKSKVPAAVETVRHILNVVLPDIKRLGGYVKDVDLFLKSIDAGLINF